jgi:hypothetical protein
MLISGALFSPDHPQRTGSRERISHVSWSRVSIFNCEGSIDHKAGEAARRQKLVPAISPGLVLVIGVAIAGVMAIVLGMSG